MEYSSEYPVVLIKRLNEKEIQYYTNKNQNQQSLSCSYNVKRDISVKQEPQDNYLENNYMTNESEVINNKSESITQDYGTNVNNENINLSTVRVKTEPQDIIEFRCKICDKISDNFEDYIIHKKMKHTKLPHTCRICNAKFCLSIHLCFHLHQHLNYSNFKNTTSTLPTEIQSSSNSNLAYNTNSIEYLPNLKCKPFKCTECLFATKSENKFLLHQDICNKDSEKNCNTNNESKCCHLCRKSFSNQTALNGHMKYHGLRGDIISKRKSAKNKKNKNNNLTKSQKVVLTNQSGSNAMKFYKCKYCNKKFITNNKLNIHHIQHQKQMLCNICNKQFFLKKSFDKHMLIHKNGTKIIDKQNSWKNVNNDNYSLDPKAIKRTIKCKFEFKIPQLRMANTKNTKQNLMLKPYQCSYCKHYYKSTKSLSEHLRVYHSTPNYVHRPLKSPSVKCKWCDAVITKPNLFRHIRNFHPEAKPVECLFCPMKFKEFSSRKLHIRECHRT